MTPSECLPKLRLHRSTAPVPRTRLSERIRSRIFTWRVRQGRAHIFQGEIYDDDEEEEGEQQEEDLEAAEVPVMLNFNFSNVLKMVLG